MFLLIVVGAQTLVGYAQKTYQATRVSTKATVDGVLDEPFWEAAPTAEGFTQIKPIAGKNASQETSVKLVYGDYALYIAAICKDNLPTVSKILCQRDDYNANTDYFSVLLDTYNDQLNGFVFSVSTCGVQYDAKIYSNSYSSKLDMIWSSAVVHSDSGWVVEMEIPYSAIRFSKEEIQNWGINFSRYISVNREESFWNSVKPDVDNIVSQSGKLLGVSQIEPPLRLFFLPYISGYAQHYPLNQEGVKNVGFNLNGGMDVKYGVNEAFTLDMTLIPDFGQVVTDNVVLNLSPFEVRFDENRQFFSEGVELFEKADLFYSRRVGGVPINKYEAENNLNENEQITTNPNTSRLYNATKLSGRTKSGLGIGVFNAISAPQYALVLDTVRNSTRKIETSPLANYNVFVLDQSLKNNSSITLTNTNVWRDGHNYDANVTGFNSQFNTKDNRYFLSANTALSQIIKETTSYGHFFTVGLGKQSGSLNYDVYYTEYSDTYDPNDLGFLYNNNTRTVSGFVSYNIYKPIWIFNRMWGDLLVSHNRIYNPNVYSETILESGVGVTSKKFHSTNLRFEAGSQMNDYFEARTPGYYFIAPNWVNVNGWFSSNYQKRFALDIGGGWSRINNADWRELTYNVSPRWRATNKLFVVYNYEQDNKIKEQGYAVPILEPTVDASIVLFGKRDVKTSLNTLDFQYTFNNKMGVSFRLRHYWSTVLYYEFYNLQTNGRLEPSVETGLNATNESIYSTSYNAFSIDVIYKWVFAPASELSIVWKNNIFTSDNYDNLKYYANLKQTLATDQLNSVSFRLVYFLDYHSLMRKK